jgi:hypothetical protein
MSHATAASALISTFVRDVPHSLPILLNDFIGQPSRFLLAQLAVDPALDLDAGELQTANGHP